MYMNEILANQMAMIVSADVAIDAFMRNDANVLINALTAHGIHPGKAKEFLTKWSYDYTRGKTSNFAIHQMRLFNMAEIANALSPSYLMNIVTNPAIMGSGNYGNLAGLETEIKKVEERIQMRKTTQRIM